MPATPWYGSVGTAMWDPTARRWNTTAAAAIPDANASARPSSSRPSNVSSASVVGVPSERL
jgi:hypothetical protein